MRMEKDSMGEKPVPENAWYGIHTCRSMENFNITGESVPKEFRGQRRSGDHPESGLGLRSGRHVGQRGTGNWKIIKNPSAGQEADDGTGA